MCCKRSERVRVEWTQSDHLQCNCWAFGVYMKVIWLIMPLLSWLCEKASEAIWIALNGFFAFRYNFSSTTWCIMVSHLSRGLRTYTRYFSGGSIGARDRSLHISLDGEFGSFVHNRDVKSFARWLLPWAVCLARETVKNCRLLLSCWSRCGGFGRKTFLFLFRKPIPRRLNRKSCRNIKKSLLFGLSRFIWLLYDFFPFDDKYFSAPAHKVTLNLKEKLRHGRLIVNRSHRALLTLLAQIHYIAILTWNAFLRLRCSEALFCSLQIARWVIGEFLCEHKRERNNLFRACGAEVFAPVNVLQKS